jgi:hypothetical protein
MVRCLLFALLMFTALASVPATAAVDAEQVVVQDPYLEFRTGPGRGYPIFYVVDRGEAVSLLRRRTDWIKVRSDRGREGWVHRSQLERTLTPQGEQVRLAGPAPESRLEHRWELGLVTGDFGGANIVSVTGSYALTQSLHARLDVTHLLGSYSNGWLATAGLLHAFMPQRRVSPFVSLGGGMVGISPKAAIVQSADRTDPAAYSGLGVRGYLTNRFLLQAEYRKFVVLTSRDDNEEIDEWTVGFTYFF